MIRHEIVGADTLASTLRGLTRDLAALPDATHRAAGESVAALAAGRARRQSGRLAAGFTVATTVDGATIANPVRYAAVQELGWPAHGITASRALLSALDDSTGTVGDTYLTAVDAAVAKVRGA